MNEKLIDAMQENQSNGSGERIQSKYFEATSQTQP